MQELGIPMSQILRTEAGRKAYTQVTGIPTTMERRFPTPTGELVGREARGLAGILGLPKRAPMPVGMIPREPTVRELNIEPLTEVGLGGYTLTEASKRITGPMAALLKKVPEPKPEKMVTIDRGRVRMMIQLGMPAETAVKMRGQELYESEWRSYMGALASKWRVTTGAQRSIQELKAKLSSLDRELAPFDKPFVGEKAFEKLSPERQDEIRRLREDP